MREGDNEGMRSPPLKIFMAGLVLWEMAGVAGLGGA